MRILLNVIVVAQVMAKVLDAISGTIKKKHDMVFVDRKLFKSMWYRLTHWTIIKIWDTIRKIGAAFADNWPLTFSCDNFERVFGFFCFIDNCRRNMYSPQDTGEQAVLEIIWVSPKEALLRLKISIFLLTVFANEIYGLVVLLHLSTSRYD